MSFKDNETSLLLTYLYNQIPPHDIRYKGLPVISTNYH